MTKKEVYINIGIVYLISFLGYLITALFLKGMHHATFLAIITGSSLFLLLREKNKSEKKQYLIATILTLALLMYNNAVYLLFATVPIATVMIVTWVVLGLGALGVFIYNFKSQSESIFRADIFLLDLLIASVILELILPYLVPSQSNSIIPYVVMGLVVILTIGLFVLKQRLAQEK